MNNNSGHNLEKFPPGTRLVSSPKGMMIIEDSKDKKENRK